MLDRNALSCAVLVLTVTAPVFAQDARPSTASEDVIQDPMPHSRAKEPEPSAPPTAPIEKSFVRAAPKSAVSLNPAMLLLGGIGVEVETAVKPNLSLFVAPSFLFFDSAFTALTNVSLSGFSVDVGVRYFSARKAPKGLWVGPYASLAFLTVPFGPSEINTTGLGFGGMVGYSWISDSSFYFSLGAGGGYVVTLHNSRIRDTAPGLALRLAFGFAG